MRNWIQEHTLQAITLVGLLFYGGALLTYSNFYAEFGVTPEEAGVDYTTALARTLPAFVSWVVEMTLVLGAVALVVLLVIVVISKRVRRQVDDYIEVRVKRVGRYIARLVQRDRTEDPNAPEPAPKLAGSTEKPELGRRKNLPPPRRGDLSTVVVGLAAVAVLFLLYAADKADDLATQVKEGKEVTPARLFANPLETRFAFWENPLRIRVDHVRVFPTTPDTRMPAGLTPRSTWALLGRTADVIVLHDVRSDREVTIRVPAGRIVLKDVGSGVTSRGG